MIIVMQKCLMKKKIFNANMEKSHQKFQLLFMLILSVCSRNYIHVKIILKNLTQRKKLSIRLRVTQCLQIVHLMKQKTNLILTEGKTVWKAFAKT